MIYLAAWPDLTFTLLRAASVEDARWKLDQFRDPSHAKVSLYDGPLCLNFEIASDDEAEWPVIEGRPDGDEGVEFIEEVLKQGYPHTYAYYQAVWRGKKAPEASEVEAAMYLDRKAWEDQLPEPPEVDVERLKAEFERVFYGDE